MACGQAQPAANGPLPAPQAEFLTDSALEATAKHPAILHAARRHSASAAAIFGLPAGTSQARSLCKGSVLAERAGFSGGGFTRQVFLQKGCHTAWHSAAVLQLGRKESRELFRQVAGRACAQRLCRSAAGPWTA